ncbi:MAG: (2Fe-2S)-binding protein [Phycisphaerales bacterium]
MSDLVLITIDGREARVSPEWSVAAAVWNARGVSGTRRSVTGDARAAACGMGVCFECRVSVDGEAGVRGCMVRCREGMRVETEAGGA